MWRNNKEWFYLAASVLLLVPGGLYFFSEADYHEYFIGSVDAPRIIQLLPDKTNNQELVIRVEGDLNVNYQLKLDFYGSQKRVAKGPSRYFRRSSEIIDMPAGKVQATFNRKFLDEPGKGKMTITYLPASKSGSGSVKIRAAIF